MRVGSPEQKPECPLFHILHWDWWSRVSPALTGLGYHLSARWACRCRAAPRTRLSPAPHLELARDAGVTLGGAALTKILFTRNHVAVFS